MTATGPHLRRRRLRWILALLVVPVLCVGAPVVLWVSFLAEYDESPACVPLPPQAPVAAAGAGVVRAGGKAEPLTYPAVVVAGQRRITAYLTNDVGWVLNPDGATYRRLTGVSVHDLRASPDGRTVGFVPGNGSAPPQQDRRFALYDIATATTRWLGVPDAVQSVEWAPDSSRLAVMLGSPGSRARSGPADILLVEAGTGGHRTVTLRLPGSAPNAELTYVQWDRDGTRLYAEWAVADGDDSHLSSVHDVDGAGQLLPRRVGIGRGGLSPNGRLAAGFGGEVLDVATGAVVSGPALRWCQDHGINRTFDILGWYDDSHVIAVHSDREWMRDQRWGEPRRKALGSRMVVMDLDGAVTQEIIGWTPGELPGGQFTA
ncbi:MAG TPA: hypothetical protein VK453_19350 [Micromonosporaceae bacterium]|nr:hypothetical protein [Micromonosporaceae bacterium]